MCFATSSLISHIQKYYCTKIWSPELLDSDIKTNAERNSEALRSYFNCRHWLWRHNKENVAQKYIWNIGLNYFILLVSRIWIIQALNLISLDFRQVWNLYYTQNIDERKLNTAVSNESFATLANLEICYTCYSNVWLTVHRNSVWIRKTNHMSLFYSLFLFYNSWRVVDRAT